MPELFLNYAGRFGLVLAVLASIAAPAAPQSRPGVEGMWGDPPVVLHTPLRRSRS